MGCSGLSLEKGVACTIGTGILPLLTEEGTGLTVDTASSEWLRVGSLGDRSRGELEAVLPATHLTRRSGWKAQISLSEPIFPHLKKSSDLLGSTGDIPNSPGVVSYSENLED